MAVLNTHIPKRWSSQLLDAPTPTEVCPKCDKSASTYIQPHILQCAMCGLYHHEDLHKPAPLAARLVNVKERPIIDVSASPEGYTLPKCKTCGGGYHALTDGVHYACDDYPADVFVTARCAVCLESGQYRLIGMRNNHP